VSRDIGTLFESFLRLAQTRPELYLLLAGRLGRGTRVPSHERIVYLGQLASGEIPGVIGAMNVSVVCNKRSSFGEYCFPQKLYEAIACGVPPLIANTSGVADLLESEPDNRYEPESVSSLMEGIERLLARPALPRFPHKPWSQHAVALSSFLESVAGARQ
jgi:glycosyltransferase involved in cell wall biosynthesis